MIIIQPKVEVLRDGIAGIKQRVERIGRVCYKSEDRITDTSASDFIEKITRLGHGSILEHGNISVKFIVDRGVSHELVRHRIAAISQESTRYVNYSKGKYEEQITVIEPFFFHSVSGGYSFWKESCEKSELCYMNLISMGYTPQEARSVLPNSLKTEVWMTCNLREWRHILQLRSSKKAHPQMRQVMSPLVAFLAKELPEVFGDIDYDITVPFAKVGWLDESVQVI